MSGGCGDAEEIAGAGLIGPGDGLAVEVFVRGELAEVVVGHFLARALGEDSCHPAAHGVGLVSCYSPEGVGLGGLQAALVVGVAGDVAEGIGHGEEAAFSKIFSSEEEKQSQEDGSEVMQTGEELSEVGSCIK